MIIFGEVSQSPFSSGEVFHLLNTEIGIEFCTIQRLSSQSPFSSGEVFHLKLDRQTAFTRCRTKPSQSPFSSGEVFH